MDRIVRASEIDWTLFLKRVKELKIKTAVYFSLAMAVDLLDTPVPDSVLEEIKPGLVKGYIMQAWIEKVGVFYPDQPKWGRVGFVLFVSLLFDSVGGFLRGVFPSREVLMDQYNFQNPMLLPFYHIKRIVNLLFKRVLG